ncbi:MAG TPA: hypothetical protein VN697_13685 [Tepidiformaceae bacterium]|nr:hypothetical protein [Tepidiformaceae bacterium]
MNEAAIPEGLNESERTLFELARERLPLAEIAVRMGVPIGEAARRIDALATRLQVDGRAGLQEWTPPALAGPEENALDVEAQPAPAPGRFSRRSFVAASVGVGMLAVGGFAAAALTRGGGPATQSNATAAASPSPAANATPEPLASLVFASNAFEHRTFAAGGLIDWPQGAFFLSTLDGRVDGWRLARAATAEQDNAVFRISDDNNVVFANTGVPYVLNRKTGRALTWKPGLLGLAAASSERLIFQRGNGPPDNANPEYTGEFTVADQSGNEVSRFKFPAGGRSVAPMLFSVSGKTVVAGGGNTSWSDYKAIYLIDVETGEFTEVGTLPDVPAGLNASAPQFTNLSGSNAWTVLVNYSPSGGPSGSSTIPEYHGFVWTYGWDGKLQRETPVFYGGDVSPNGRYVASESWMRFVVGGAVGDRGEVWPVVVVSDTATGAPLFRVKSASLDYGDGLLGSRWNPDSSAFLIQTGPPGPPAPGTRNQSPQYASVNIELLAVNPIPLSGGDWWAGPVPSQALSGIYALGHTTVFTVGSSGRSFSAAVPGIFTQHIAPWGNPSDEVRFALPHGGHDGGLPLALLAPAIEHAPFSDALSLIVSGTGDCLNIRPEPNFDVTPLACVPDGTELDVTVPETPLAPGAAIVASVANEHGTWIHVVASLSDGSRGVEGWASADYLRWR